MKRVESSVAQSVDAMKALLDSLQRRFSPLELPEPSPILDLASRQGSQVRQLKHLQQMCLLHAAAFVRSSQTKVMYGISGYLAMVDARNPLGIYSMARVLAELNANLCLIHSRLSKCVGGQFSGWRE